MLVVLKVTLVKYMGLLTLNICSCQGFSTQGIAAGFFFCGNLPIRRILFVHIQRLKRVWVMDA